jgi:hypothetical protein
MERENWPGIASFLVEKEKNSIAGENEREDSNKVLN